MDEVKNDDKKNDNVNDANAVKNDDNKNDEAVKHGSPSRFNKDNRITDSELKDYAEKYYKAGFSTLLLNGKQPVYSGWTERQPYEAYLHLINYLEKNRERTLLKLQKRGLTDKELVDRAENFSSGFNIGIVCGNLSGIFVIDIDAKNYGLETWNKIISRNGNIDTLTVSTGGGGFHIYLRYTDRFDQIGNRISSITDENGNRVSIDIRTNRGYVAAPPSIHPKSGFRYAFISEHEDGEIPTNIAEMPDWLFKIITSGSSLLPGDNPVTKPIEYKTIAFRTENAENDENNKSEPKPVKKVTPYQTHCLNAVASMINQLPNDTLKMVMDDIKKKLHIEDEK